MNYFCLFLLFFATAASAGDPKLPADARDLYATEFVETAGRVVSFLRYNGSSVGLDLDRLERTIKSTLVESTQEGLFLNGLPKDAINYPSQGRIVFSRPRWAALTPGQKPVLVLHEYLSLLGIEDASYAFSRMIMGSFEYSIEYGFECFFNDGKSDLNIGIDEAASGDDTILLTINWGPDRSDSSNSGLPTGEFSRMIRDGKFTMTFDEQYLITAHSEAGPKAFKGFLAAEGKTVPIECRVKKWDYAGLDRWDREHGE